jgi:hypothetical protein
MKIEGEAGMRRGTLALVVALMVAAGAAPARAADEFTPAAHLDNMVLDFDSDAGKLSVWQINDTAALNAVRATLQIHRIGQDPRWAPGANIELKNGDDYILFQVLSPQRAVPFVARMVRSHGGKQAEEQTFALTVGLDEKLDIAVDWTSAGAVTVTARGETHSMSLGLPVAVLQFSGTTGEVEFNPLAIGRVP